MFKKLFSVKNVNGMSRSSLLLFCRCENKPLLLRLDHIVTRRLTCWYDPGTWGLAGRCNSLRAWPGSMPPSTGSSPTPFFSHGEVSSRPSLLPPSCSASVQAQWNGFSQPRAETDPKQIFPPPKRFLWGLLSHRWMKKSNTKKWGRCCDFNLTRRLRSL